MSDSVFVVIGSKGEYSDRYEWVAGVFTDKRMAVGLAQEKLRESKAADAVDDDWCKCRIGVVGSIFNVVTPDMSQRIVERCGTRPGAGVADDYTVVEAKLNEWTRATEVTDV